MELPDIKTNPTPKSLTSQCSSLLLVGKSPSGRVTCYPKNPSPPPSSGELPVTSHQKIEKKNHPGELPVTSYQKKNPSTEELPVTSYQKNPPGELPVTENIPLRQSYQLPKKIPLQRSYRLPVTKKKSPRGSYQLPVTKKNPPPGELLVTSYQKKSPSGMSYRLPAIWYTSWGGKN